MTADLRASRYKRKHSPSHYARRIVGDIARHPANRGHLLRALGRAGIWQVRKRLRPIPLDIDFEGMVLRCYPDSGSASNVFYFTSRFDFDEMAFLERYLRPGDGFLDIGANIGTYSLFVASLVGISARIEAFEPLPVCAQRIREHVDLNALSNVAVHEMAVGDHEGMVEFYNADVSSEVTVPGRYPTTFMVPIGRIDDAVSQRGFAAAKLDVEGSEMAALRGATGMLARADPPVWQIELIESQLAKLGTSSNEVVRFLADHGFSPAWFDVSSGSLDFAPEVWSSHSNIFFVADRHRDRVQQRLDQRAGGADRAR